MFSVCPLSVNPPPVLWRDPKSGVSHQAPYYYFDDREAILAAIAGEGFSTLGQSSLRAVARAGSEPAKALEAIGRAYVGFALRHPAYFQAMFRADAVPLDRYPDVPSLKMKRLAS